MKLVALYQLFVSKYRQYWMPVKCYEKKYIQNQQGRQYP
nr:MAG TPA: hypothetical protein [Bacteriophage sp.]